MPSTTVLHARCSLVSEDPSLPVCIPATRINVVLSPTHTRRSRTGLKRPITLILMQSLMSIKCAQLIGDFNTSSLACPFTGFLPLHVAVANGLTGMYAFLGDVRSAVRIDTLSFAARDAEAHVFSLMFDLLFAARFCPGACAYAR